METAGSGLPSLREAGARFSGSQDAIAMSTAMAHSVRTETERAGDGVALAVADVGWFNTRNLFNEIDRDATALLKLQCMDYLNGWRRGQYPWSPACRLRRSGPRAWEQQFVLPTGWMKRYPRLGMRPIARTIRSWWEGQAPWRRGLVMTYPHYLPLRDLLRPEVSVYYCIDDFALYWPRQAEQVRELERRMVREADVTICVSRLRTEELRKAVPEADFRIHHLPHGAPSAFLAANPLDRPGDAPEDIGHLPRPLLGYIGSLEDRVDWELMDRLSREFAEASIVVVGRNGTPPDRPWGERCARFLSRPNVHAIGWRPQESLGRYYQSFDVALIPYLLDHPFNRACNPTKIMDAMGSGRPIVATAIPECRLHSERFHVAEDQGGFLAAVRRILEDGSDDGRAAVRHAYALANTCHGVGDRLMDLVQAATIAGGDR